MARIQPLEDVEASREAQDVPGQLNDIWRVGPEEAWRLGTMGWLRADPEAVCEDIATENHRK